MLSIYLETWFDKRNAWAMKAILHFIFKFWFPCSSLHGDIVDYLHSLELVSFPAVSAALLDRLPDVVEGCAAVVPGSGCSCAAHPHKACDVITGRGVAAESAATPPACSSVLLSP